MQPAVGKFGGREGAIWESVVTSRGASLQSAVYNDIETELGSMAQAALDDDRIARLVGSVFECGKNY